MKHNLSKLGVLDSASVIYEQLQKLIEGKI